VDQMIQIAITPEPINCMLNLWIVKLSSLDNVSTLTKCQLKIVLELAILQFSVEQIQKHCVEFLCWKQMLNRLLEEVRKCCVRTLMSTSRMKLISIMFLSQKKCKIKLKMCQTQSRSFSHLPSLYLSILTFLLFLFLSFSYKS
jgi:hypothetical protein